jgi:hypothetical protein
LRGDFRDVFLTQFCLGKFKDSAKQQYLRKRPYQTKRARSGMSKRKKLEIFSDYI